jgi:cysteine desulfurase
MGLDERRARAAIRFSLGRFTTADEVDFAVRQTAEIVERLRRSSTAKK